MGIIAVGCPTDIFFLQPPWDTKNYINPDKELHKSHWIEYQEDKQFANMVGHKYPDCSN